MSAMDLYGLAEPMNKRPATGFLQQALIWLIKAKFVIDKRWNKFYWIERMVPLQIFKKISAVQC